MGAIVSFGLRLTVTYVIFWLFLALWARTFPLSHVVKVNMKYSH